MFGCVIYSFFDLNVIVMRIYRRQLGIMYIACLTKSSDRMNKDFRSLPKTENLAFSMSDNHRHF